MEWVVVAAALLLAFVNGANDNFKAVATVYGSKLLSYRQCVALTTVATAAGSIASVALAAGLVRTFSGKGLVPDELLDASLLGSVGLGAALTVLFATRLGLPISTTHALVGGIVGAGLVAAEGQLRLAALGAAFLLPLLLGPLLAHSCTRYGLGAARYAFRRLGITPQSCVCVGGQQIAECPVHRAWAPAGPAPETIAALPVALESRAMMTVSLGSAPDCEEDFVSPHAAVTGERAIYWGHIASASAVAFARGLNDTPKILGIVVGTTLFSPLGGSLAIAAFMAMGGVLAARRVADTLATKITPISTGQGLMGNLTTSLLVIGASRFGLPVSTTHVSTGAIMGIGGVDGSLDARVVRQILAAGVPTVPMAIAISAALMWGIRHLK